MFAILLKRLLRHMKRRKLKYAAMLVFVMAISAITSALVGSGITIIDGRKQNAASECIEDGQFSLLLPMSEEDENQLEEDYQVQIEEHFYFDVQGEGNKTIRLFKPRSIIDKPTLEKGNLPLNEKEIAIDTLYANTYEVELGDNLEVAGYDMKVSGIISIPDYVRPLAEMSDVSVDLSSFTYVAVSKETYDALLIEGGYEENYVYAYRYGKEIDKESFYTAIRNLDLDYWGYASSHPLVYQYLKEWLKKKGISIFDIKEVESAVSELANQATLITPREDNPRMGEEMLYAELYRNIGMAIGGFLLILLSLIFTITLKQEVNEDAAQIGSLYALGVGKKMLWAYYLIPSAIIAFLGGAIGLMVAYSPLVMNLCLNAFHVAYSFPTYGSFAPWYLYLYALVLPVLVSLLVNFISLASLFNQSVMSVVKTPETGKVSNSKLFDSMPIKKRIAFRMGKRNIPGFVAMFSGLFLSSLLLLLGLNTRVMTTYAENSCLDIPYEYSYVIRYPVEDLKDNNGDRLYMKSYHCLSYGEKVEVSLVGLPKEHQCYSKVTFSDENEVVIASSFASKSGLKIGESATLYRNSDNKAFSFEVSNIVSTGPELAIYLPIAKALELENEVTGAYNVVVSNSPLEIAEEYIASISSKQSITNSFKVVESTMTPFITMSLISSILLALSFLYVILQGILTTQRRSIALYSVVGYSDKEIGRMFTLPIVAITFLLLLISLPLSKLAADLLCPYFYAKMALGMVFQYPVWLILLLVLGATILVGGVLLYIFHLIKKIDISAFIADENNNL